MRARLTGAAAAVALVVVAALAPVVLAQEPVATPTPSTEPSPTPEASPTPTPTPTPEEEARAKRDARDRKSKPVRRIYRDFERDGRIDDCDHTRKALRRALRSVKDSYAEENPDFKDALKAAIERHDKGKCVEVAPPTETPTPAPAPAPAPGTGTPPSTTPPAAAPISPPPPVSTPQSGKLPDFGVGGGSTQVTPLPGENAIPEGTPVPPAATPAPSAAPPQPPRLVVTRASADPNLFVPGTLLAIALLGLLFTGLSAVAARRSGRLAAVGHAWREAWWRASGTWTEFTDWLRTGR
jgi:hypothetical protein